MFQSKERKIAKIKVKANNQYSNFKETGNTKILKKAQVNYEIAKLLEKKYINQSKTTKNTNFYFSNTKNINKFSNNKYKSS